MPHLQIITSTTRPGAVGPSVARWIAAEAVRHDGFEVEIVDLAKVGLPFLDEPEHPAERRYVHQHTRDWSARIDAADAFVFVTAEYNFGFTAPVKNAIDYLHDEWQYKPVGFVSYGMTSMGLRAVQMLKQVVTTLKMVPVTEAVTIPLRQVLGEDGTLHPTGAMNAAAAGMLDELGRMTTALAPLRAGTATLRS